MKKKFLWIVIGLVLLASTFLIYWFYFTTPSSFPETEQLIKEIDPLLDNTDAQVIQDTILIDEQHALVPFISQNGEHGLSFWAWKWHSWRVEMVNTRGEPKIWKVNREDLASYYFVWNLHPDDQLQALQFYLIHERGYQVTDGIERYYPRVQLKQEISLKEQSYGVLKMPADWVAVTDATERVATPFESNLLFSDFFPEQSLFFGWIPYDRFGKELYPENSVNGNSYSDGDLYVDYLMILDEIELELP